MRLVARSVSVFLVLRPVLQGEVVLLHVPPMQTVSNVLIVQRVPSCWGLLLSVHPLHLHLRSVQLPVHKIATVLHVELPKSNASQEVAVPKCVVRSRLELALRSVRPTAIALPVRTVEQAV